VTKDGDRTQLFPKYCSYHVDIPSFAMIIC